MAPRPSREEPATFEVDEVLKETEHAILVTIEGEEHWVPKSQILEESEVQGEDDSGTLVVTSWWARKEGLE